MDLLVYLASRPNQVVSKQDLLNEVWRTEAISESALTRSMTELRQALDDSVSEPQVIETIPKRGYRLIAPVSEVSNETRAIERTSSSDIPRGRRHYAVWAIAAALIFGAATWGLTRPRMATGRMATTERPWFEQVTTKSPRALHSYALAAALMPSRSEEAKPHLLDALREDPDFASAHTLYSYVLYNTAANPSEYLAHAETAFRLSSATTSAERHFITASLFSMRAYSAHDRQAREKYYALAIPEYEAAIEQQPDNVWAIWNVGEMYRDLGRRSDNARTLLHLAELQSSSFSIQAQAASAVLEASGVSAARPIFARASRLLESGANDHMNPVARQFVELFPAHEAWLQGGGAEATALIDAAVARQRDHYDDGCWNRLGMFRLALGQLRQAEEAFGHVTGLNLRSLGFGSLAAARNDRAGIVNHLALFPQHWDPAAVSLLVRAGDLARAARQLKSMNDVGEKHRQWADEEIREAAGDAAVIRRAVQAGAPWADVMAGVRTFMYSETQARAAANLGDADGAIRVLTASNRLHDATLTATGHSGYYSMRNRVLLADLYRRTGRAAEAQAIETAMRGALAAADADFPLLLELNGRVH